jgi:serine/threonine-protein kinase RsbW
VISSDLESARKLEEEILRLASESGYGEGATFAIKLALEEGLANAIKHGNRCDCAKTVEFRLDIDPSKLEFTITDQGCGFDPACVPDPTAEENLEKPSGRGIMLMRAYMDEVRYNPAGNQVYMLKRNQ